MKKVIFFTEETNDAIGQTTFLECCFLPDGKPVRIGNSRNVSADDYEDMGMVYVLGVGYCWPN